MGLTPLQEVLEIRIDNSVQSSIKAAIDAYLARRLPHRIVSMSVT